ncbi:hypothetical protein [Mucilaginibacter xinganensis]|uniref:Uncharacterized protein n=1 Tax=Mucilaginibacter xinganensis TaxID=1234841 RepID=A0A223P0S5_9SPHI|nr:hypothetical protein [Mucilaginibacter xinganensis]ASU35705.1 hypothetical protein MuYL_3820 [Mucilaginibacter xinganensis]
MKLNLRSTLPLLMGVAFFYSACKKVDNSTPASSKNTDEASLAIAKNLVQSLNGSLGGAALKDGIKISPNLMSTSKIKLQSTDVQCGFYRDSSLNLDYRQGDTVRSHTTGNINYFFVCNEGKTIGYDLLDSISTVGKGPGYTFAYALAQNYHVRGLNSNNSNFSLNGTLKSYADNEYTVYVNSSASVHNIYTFSDLYVHADDNFDITSGTATFQSIGKTHSGAWDYSGSIVFLGNHKAKLTFLSKVYWVDLTTGAVTPA